MKYKILTIVILSVFISNICFAKRYVGVENSCMNNMRVITSAIEMYNMDHSGGEQIKKIMLRNASTIIERLKREKYIKSVDWCRDTRQYSYYSIGDLSTDGTLACLVHGALDGRPAALDGKENKETFRMANSSKNVSSYEIQGNFMMSLGLSITLTLVFFIIIKLIDFLDRPKTS